MGCDIHIWIELGYRKYKNCSLSISWSHGFPFHIWRDYNLFAVLANVRNDGSLKYYPARGFPKDASEEIKKDYEHWNGDAHTSSWLTLEELKRINWDQRGLVYTKEYMLRIIIPFLEYQSMNELFPLRLVFWFDN